MARNVIDDRGEAAIPEGGGGFADYVLVSLHCLWICLDESYCNALDLLNEMPHILAGIGLKEGDFPDHSTLVKAFDRFQMEVWQVLLRLSTQLHGPSGHAAINATFFDRESASKHYCRRANYHVQTLEATALVGTQTQTIPGIHCTAKKVRNAQPGWQVACHNVGDLHNLAADEGYNWMQLREKLHEEDMRPLIKHHIFRSIDHTHNARVSGPRYHQRSMCKTVLSSIKRTHDDVVRAQTWYRGSRELALKYVVYSIRRVATQPNQPLCDDPPESLDDIQRHLTRYLTPVWESSSQVHFQSQQDVAECYLHLINERFRSVEVPRPSHGRATYRVVAVSSDINVRLTRSL